MNAIAPTLDSPIVHPAYVKLLCMAVRQQGHDVQAVLTAAGLGAWREFAASDALLSHRSVNRAIRQALQLSARPWLALEFGATVQVSAHGPLGYAAVASSNLRQALQTVARYGAIRHGGVRFLLHESQDGAMFELVLRFDLEDGHDFVVTLLGAILFRLMEAVAGGPMHGLRVDLPIAEPPWSARLQALFECPLRFGALRLAFHLDPEVLDRPCLTADALAYDMVCKECEKLMTASATSAGMAQRVQQLLLGREGRYPTLGAAAALFSVSPRTLIRRLKDEDTSFQTLLDAARQQRAMWYLENTQHTVEDIAARLGYVDTTNFSRTFRRWYGITPSEVRKPQI